MFVLQEDGEIEEKLSPKTAAQLEAADSCTASWKPHRSLAVKLLHLDAKKLSEKGARAKIEAEKAKRVAAEARKAAVAVKKQEKETAKIAREAATANKAAVKAGKAALSGK